MKHLLLSLLFSASLAAFSQADTTDMYLQPDRSRWTTYPGVLVNDELIGCYRKPDTLRAYILVTMCRRCAAETMPGYVVICVGKRPVYLDCRKRALKWPQVGWGYVEVDPNTNQK